jgi:hypothetical protein
MRSDPERLRQDRRAHDPAQINYRMPHGLWTIWQELPVVRVPPLLA